MNAAPLLYKCIECWGSMFVCRKCAKAKHEALRVALPDEHNLCSDCVGITRRAPDNCVSVAVFA